MRDGRRGSGDGPRIGPSATGALALRRHRYALRQPLGMDPGIGMGRGSGDTTVVLKRIGQYARERPVSGACVRYASACHLQEN